MKTIGFGVVIASLALLQPAEAGWRGGSRGGGRSFSSGHHYSGSGGHFAGRSRGYSGGSRFSGTPARFYSGGGQGNRSYSGGGQRVALNRTNAGNRGAYAGQRHWTGRNRGTAADSQRFQNGGRVIARHGANWNRHWDRRRDHYWRGHRCRWVNNSWVIFATGFYPYGFGYPYAYGYYPYASYAYDDGYYDERYASDEYSQEQGEDYAGNPDSSVSRVQHALAREGYYRGTVDGSLGPATRNALRRYQREHGLDVTGEIDRAVLDALGVR